MKERDHKMSGEVERMMLGLRMPSIVFCIVWYPVDNVLESTGPTNQA